MIRLSLPPHMAGNRQAEAWCADAERILNAEYDKAWSVVRAELARIAGRVDELTPASAAQRPPDIRKFS